MAEKAAELTIVLRARNLLKAQLDKAGKQLDKQIAKIRQYQKEIRLASRAALAVGVIGAALFTGAIVQAAGFEKALSNVSAVTKANIEDQKRLRDAALEQGSKSVFAASQVAEAQLFLGQAGQSTTQIIQSLDGVLSLAAATSSELGFASEVTAATLSQFSLKAGEASRVANVFAASSSVSQATLNKLAFAMRQAGPDASALGQSLEGTTAALNAFFDLGLKGEQAGTVLRAALVGLAKPSAEAGEILERLGIQIFDTSGKMLPFVDIVEQLEKANLSTTDSFTIFGQEAGGKMAKLVAKGSEALRAMENNITGTDEAARQAKVRLNNLSGSVTFLKSAIEGASISIGSQYIPIIRTATDLLTRFVSGFNDLDPAVQAWIAHLLLGLTALVGFMGALGLLVVSLAVTELALGALALGFLPIVAVIAKVGVAFALFAAGLVLTRKFAAMQNVAVAFFEFFERGLLGISFVFNFTFAAIALLLQKTFQALRTTALKPLDLIFEALKKIMKSIDTNPFDLIDDALTGLQRHTDEVVVNIVKDLHKVSAEYDDIHDNINKASEAQDSLKDATDKTSKSINDQVDNVGRLADAHVKAFDKFQKTVVLPEKIKEAFDLTGLVSTADSVAEMDKLEAATILLLEAGNLSIEQERDLIDVFNKKANAITGVTKRLKGMTDAANEYNSAIDALLAVRLNSFQDDLEKTLAGIIDPKSLKKKAQEAEKILIAFSNNTEGASSGLVNQDALADFKKRAAEGEEAMLSLRETNEGMVTTVKNTADGYGALSFAMSATEKKIEGIKGAVRAHQNQLDELFNGPLAAQQEYIEKLNASGASVEQLSKAENRLKKIQSARVSSMVASEEAGLRELKNLRDANLKDIEENNARIATLEQARANNARALEDIKIQRREAGLSREEKRSREFSRLNLEFLTKIPVLDGEKQVVALDRILKKSQAIASSAKEGSSLWNQALSLQERVIKKQDAIQAFDLAKDKAGGSGLAAQAERFKIATASMEESIDGFSQKLRALQTEIANANLQVAVDLLDNATGPGKEIRDSLRELFGTPIIQEVIIQQTTRFSGSGFSGGDENIFAGDRLADFQFGSGESGPVILPPESFAKGINYIQRDSLALVHKGEKILSRSEADRVRGGEGGSRSITFTGPINVYAAPGQDVSEETARAIRDRINKINDMERG